MTIGRARLIESRLPGHTRGTQSRPFAVEPTPAGCSHAAAHASNFASIVMCVFSSFDTGHPVLALFAISWNFALSVPGILADTVRWLAVISKPAPTFSS